ncbi:MAG: NAD(P)/FAD-dependent oxidoreductase [Candidatus Heimdallarchaeota archaeon]|nr:NAD(P)/FAD-dependent oxidoreductase [Candidatus Heimdallarchaeota archaeon]
MLTYDVIIIGGGPAGLSAANTTSKSGLNTIVLEEHGKIGEPLACGEGISIDKISTLENMPNPEFQLDDNALQLQQHHSFVERIVRAQRFFFGNTGVATSSLNTVTINRPLFDQLMAKNAEKNGALIKLNTAVKGIHRNQGKLELITTQGNFQSKIVIGCDGPASHSVRMMGLSPPSKYVQAVEYKIDGVFTDALDFYFNFNILKMHYGWVFPKKVHTNVGVVVDPASSPMKILNLFTDYLENKDIKNAKIVRKIAGIIPAGGPIPKYYTDNFMAAGDAAGMTNSIFYGGIAISIHSAALAAQIAKDAYETNDFSANFLKQYAELCQQFPYTNPIIQQAHEILYDYFTAEDLDTLGKWFNGWDITEFSKMQKIKIFLKAMTKPKLLRKFNNAKTLAHGFSTSRDWGF